MQIISGFDCQNLADSVAKTLAVEHINTAAMKFADGELNVKFLKSIASEHIVIIKSTSPPANDNLMELLLLINTAKNYGAKKVTAVIPYFGYSRQDHDMVSPAPVELIPKLLKAAGADQVLTIDLHSRRLLKPPIIPIHNLSVAGLFAKHIAANRYPELVSGSHEAFSSSAEILKLVQHDMMVVAPDFGAMERTRAVGSALGLKMVVIEKNRLQNRQYRMILQNGAVKNKHCIIIDDIIDGGGTICKASEILIEQGALAVDAYVTHPVFAYRGVLELLAKSRLRKVYITDTVSTKHIKLPDKIEVLSVETVLAEGIRGLL